MEKKNYKNVSYSIDKDILQEFHIIAATKRVVMSGIVEQLMIEYINKNKIDIENIKKNNKDD